MKPSTPVWMKWYASWHPTRARYHTWARPSWSHCGLDLTKMDALALRAAACFSTWCGNCQAVVDGRGTPVA